MEQNENKDKQLFAYQREEQMMKEQDKYYEKIAKKQAKQAWKDSLGHSKRSYRPQLFLRIDADGIYLQEQCQPWENRLISYN